MSHARTGDPPIIRLVRQSLFVAAVAVLAGRVAVAQESPSLRTHHVTLGAGVLWAGGYDVGDATAELRGNAIGASAPAFNWFNAKSRFTPAAAPEFHVGFALSPTLAIDGAVSYARPRIAVAIAGDAEAPSQELAGEKIEQYEFGAGVTWQLPVATASRFAPFVALGGAYLRQLHEDSALAETGRIYYAGGGARYWLRGGRGRATAAGVRVDARVNLRKDGIDFEQQMRAYPTLTLSLFVGL
jgi:hypothetical protein